MNADKEYAAQWDVSSEFFFEKGYYHWMCQKIKDYHTVLEIGCGTGLSTLALLQTGHNVIAIDKNPECLAEAKKRIANSGINEERITFIQGDITNQVFQENDLSNYSFDIAVCWNIGTAWEATTLNEYMPYLLEYGLNINQISEDPESSYGELILWNTCRIASGKHVPVQLVERGTQVINKHNDVYYYRLKEEFGFSSISYKHHYGESVSKGGRILSTRGTPHNTKRISIIFLSIIMR